MVLRLDGGIKRYQDGSFIQEYNVDSSVSRIGGYGKMVVGRELTGVNDKYVSVEIDELIFWNEILPKQQIEALYLLRYVD